MSKLTPFGNYGLIMADPRGPLNHLLVLICAIFLVAPKINLIQISGQTSGIRADDVFVVLAMPFLLMRIKDAIPFLGSMRIYVLFVVMALVSALVNVEANGWKLVLYPMRLVEYLTFILFGALCTSRNLLIAVSSLIILLNTSVSIGQMFLDWGGFPYSRYAPDVGSRAIGLTAGPWEMAATVNLSLAYLGYAWNRSPRQIGWFLSFYMISLVCMILSGSRVGLVVNTVIGCLFLFGLNLSWLRKIGLICLILMASVFTFKAVPNSLGERSRDLLQPGNVEHSLRIGGQNDCQMGEAGGIIDFAVISDGQHDPSWGVRAQKWARAACIYAQDSGNYLLGVGPGYFGPALDGGFIRVLVEHGLVGVILLFAVLLGGDAAFRRYRVITMTFAAHMVFIDIYLSYKFMSLMFFLLAAIQALDRHELRGSRALDR